MKQVQDIIQKVADSPSTVLITGESGTGKELVALALHNKSSRHDKPFIRINAAAIPPTLIEAELFGHVRGAFTGAIGTRQGRFEQANKGTLFLDEVGTMSTALQMKLLRALQEREFERVGDNQTIKVDVRVIAATNSELSRMVAEGAFREDLFFRLNVINVQLPPLRDRRDDIPVLVKPRTLRQGHGNTPLARRDARADGVHLAGKCPPTRERGGTRRGAVRASHTSWTSQICRQSCTRRPTAHGLRCVDLPEAGLDLAAYLSVIERDLIARALERTRGNRNRAAELLRIKRTTLVEKLDDWALSDAVPQAGPVTGNTGWARPLGQYVKIEARGPLNCRASGPVGPRVSERLGVD